MNEEAKRQAALKAIAAVVDAFQNNPNAILAANNGHAADPEASLIGLIATLAELAN